MDRREERNMGRRETTVVAGMGGGREGGSEEGQRQGGRALIALAEFVHCKAYRPKGHVAFEEGTTHVCRSKTSSEQSSTQWCQPGQRSCFLETRIIHQRRTSRRNRGWKQAGGTQKPSTAMVDVSLPWSVKTLQSNGVRCGRQQNGQPLKSCPCLCYVRETELVVPKPQSSGKWEE